MHILLYFCGSTRLEPQRDTGRGYVLRGDGTMVCSRVRALPFHYKAILPSLHTGPAAGIRCEVVLVTVREQRVVIGRGDQLVGRVDRHPLPVRVVALHADVRQLGLLLVAVVGLGVSRR